MKRIMAAAFIAIMFHVMIFVLNPVWLSRKKMYDKKAPVITVTMSYRKPAPALKSLPKQVVREIIKKETKSLPEISKVPVPDKAEERIVSPEPETAPSIDATEDLSYLESVIDETEYPEFSDAPAEVPGVSEAITEAEPLYRVNPEPPYPKMARRRGYQGTVLLSVLVNKEGRAENIWVFESSGYNILDNAALEAVKEWLFEPGKQGNKPVDVWVEVPVKFEIK
ncbi:MAG: energy transducer TonB [Deltaproteobacteria bacterium]|jgi:protein TonB|nr:energy transducer TonB [Deltaproteobacteria bacterium]